MSIQTKPFNPKEKVERNKKIFALRKEGLSHNQIAKEVDTTPQNVRRILIQHVDKYK